MSVVGDLATMAGGDAARVYKIGAVPTSPPYPYRVVSYAPNTPPVRTQDGAGNPTRRFTVQHFGRTAESVEAAADASLATFDGKPIGGDVCVLEVATPPFRDPDDSGVLSTTHTYRF